MRFVGLLVWVGCQPGAGDLSSPTGSGILGGDDHDVSDLLEVWGDEDDGHDAPQDLAFNPEVDGELWVVNKKDDSTTIYNDVGGEGHTSEHIVDPYALHFMEKVTSIAFGAPGTFATCQDGTNSYNRQGEGNLFTGPTLWTSDRSVFGLTNPEAVDSLGGTDLGSHIDMLHESPECMGIAWDHDNVYWVFDGYHGNIVRYDFQQDHGPGYDDHSDGIIARYINADVVRRTAVPSHMILDHDTGLLYIADTGNARITVLDTTTGREGDPLPRFEPGTDHHEVRGADYSTLIDGVEHGLEQPSGLELYDGQLLVSDGATGELFTFSLDGELIDWAATGASPAGLMMDPDGSALWMVDRKSNQLLRLPL
ncbi:MAG TPA: hypothetical protein ENK18_01150 [Deltaproteobacteria bacterium]|nr:hypothetical protein [Deltaproteobacteria bacterium]